MRIARTGEIVHTIASRIDAGPRDGVQLSDHGLVTLNVYDLQEYHTAFNVRTSKRIKPIQHYPDDFIVDPLTLYLEPPRPELKFYRTLMFCVADDSDQCIALFYVNQRRYVAVCIPLLEAEKAVALEIQITPSYPPNAPRNCAYDAAHGRLWVCFQDEVHALELDGAMREAHPWRGYTPAGAAPAIVREAALLAALRSVLRPEVPDEMLLHIFSYL